MFNEVNVIFFTGRRPLVLRLRTGHDRRSVLDCDGAAQVRDEEEEARVPGPRLPLRSRVRIRLPTRSVGAAAGERIEVEGETRKQ